MERQRDLQQKIANTKSALGIFGDVDMVDEEEKQHNDTDGNSLESRMPVTKENPEPKQKDRSSIHDAVKQR